MAQPKKADKPAAPAAPTLAKAAESGDPTVQYLLAERESVLSNMRSAPNDEVLVEDAKRRLDDIAKSLADLGFE